MRADTDARTAPARVLGLTALLGAAGMGAAGTAVGAAVGSVHRAPAGTGQLAVAGLAFSYPRANAAAGLMLVLAGLGAMTIAAAVRATWRQRRAYRRFLARVDVLGPLDGHPAVNVIAGARPEAFCAGFLRPTIYVSRGALKVLAPIELLAVLAHEHQHLRARDPLRLACGRILAHALFFVPVLHPLRDRYADLAELRADFAAVQATAGRPQPLASALLLFDAGARPGTTGVSAARVDSLLGKPHRWHISSTLLIGSLALLVAFCALVWRTSAGASARATLNVPVISSAPCLSLVLILALLVGIGAARLRPRAATT